MVNTRIIMITQKTQIGFIWNYQFFMNLVFISSKLKLEHPVSTASGIYYICFISKEET